MKLLKYGLISVHINGPQNVKLLLLLFQKHFPRQDLFFVPSSSQNINHSLFLLFFNDTVTKSFPMVWFRLSHHKGRCLLFKMKYYQRKKVVHGQKSNICIAHLLKQKSRSVKFIRGPKMSSNGIEWKRHQKEFAHGTIHLECDSVVPSLCYRRYKRQ